MIPRDSTKRSEPEQAWGTDPLSSDETGVKSSGLHCDCDVFLMIWDSRDFLPGCCPQVMRVLTSGGEGWWWERAAFGHRLLDFPDVSCIIPHLPYGCKKQP